VVKLADLARGTVQVVAEVLTVAATPQQPTTSPAPAASPPAAPTPAPDLPLSQLTRDMFDPFLESRRIIAEQQEQIAGLEKRLADVTGERDKLAAELAQARRERGQAVGELTRVHLEKSAAPRTVAELRAWRESRHMTQRQAAEALGVGHATIDRAEAQAPEAPLGRALLRAFAAYEAEVARQLEAQRQAAAAAQEAERQRQAAAARQRQAEAMRQRQAEAMWERLTPTTPERGKSRKGTRR